ncbi:SIS domain-containing protein [Pararhizobium sp.]|uniref:SIS domain-containing protein n=1 Tax=Pararhizobium sp. TaxID=1977563 RepID=UPI0027280AA0|nr:SIS domain-containing protein [Pararhizobium sp.]MDO9417935.1 SIS domain-containing protein [Pararhizobium sp.]
MSKSYLDEIAEQPAAIRSMAKFLTTDFAGKVEGLRAAIDSGVIRHLILTGMGGSLFSAYGTWLRLSEGLNIPVSLWDTSELIQQAPALLRDGTMIIAISQSGESVELRRMAEIDTASSLRVSITNTPENSLTRWAGLSMATEVGPEQTVSTKTYTAGLVALYILETLLLGGKNDLQQEIDALADSVETLIPQMQTEAPKLLAFIGHDQPIVFIGRGTSYGSAAMAALVTAEAAKAYTSALSGGQFRHGPLELVRDGFRSILFMGDGAGRSLNAKTANDIAGFGGRCLVIEPEDANTAASASVQTLALPKVAEGLLPVLEILPIQLLMVPMAIARSFEPAKFLNGSKITIIE